MRVALPIAALVALLALAAVPPPARAASGACVVGTPGPVCSVWSGRVVFVGDGDTLDVDVAGDRTRRPRRVRVTGIQAMEQTTYSSRGRRGDCHAVEATLRLERLVRRAGGRVRLAAQDAESRSHNRLLRTVAVRIGGRWRDVGTIMLREGRALSWASWDEWAPNAAYRALLQRAAAGARGLFDPDACGEGPSAASPLAVWVNWDADGNDTANPAGEWVRIKNHDPLNAVALDGWYLRDSGVRRFTFPAGAAIAPRGSVTVNVGVDDDPRAAPGTLFNWGLRNPVFENAGQGPSAMGDGAYLFDPLGNVRAHMVYPCADACADPLRDLVSISADPATRRESITITNLTAGPLDLEGRVVRSPPYSYHLGPNTVLPAGASLRLLVPGAPEEDTPLTRHWGFARPILRNAGDVVRLSTYDDLTLACAAWGDRSC